jgi:type III pantothenate kinase
MMIAIDVGNTRIKWGIHDGGEWIERGAFPTSAVANLAGLAGHWPQSARVVACNVAGEAVERAVEKALALRFPLPLWLRSGAEQCGVRNGYEEHWRLGADRWAALIAARGRQKGDCLVVCAGTATTIDWLDASGLFRGGLILPGIDLMRSSLARNTAQLPALAGEFRDEPRSTRDAIASGCLHAQIGAIERMFARLPVESKPVCLLTGGAAEKIAPYLAIPFQFSEHLILDGLVRFATSQ